MAGHHSCRLSMLPVRPLVACPLGEIASGLLHIALVVIYLRDAIDLFGYMAAMTVAQIVASESGNKDRIHLYREGLFLKAYDRSAFLFQKHVKSFKPIKKFFKSVNGDVIMLGFPSGNLSALLPETEFLERDEMHVCFACPEINLREYELWFGSVPMAPEKPRRKQAPADAGFPSRGESILREEAQAPAAMSVTLFTPEDFVPAGDVVSGVIRDLEAFSVENSTPLECMMFLSGLKKELKKRGNGSGGI